MNSISRAQFLRGDWKGTDPDIRPPWALTEPAFSDVCDGCGECVTACSQKIIFMSRGKLPKLDYSQAGCTFCGDCVTVCEVGALSHSHQQNKHPWQLKADISTSCLAIAGTSCVRCIEECEHDAIVSKPALGGRMNMQVDALACTGCGMCIAKCPVDAIHCAIPAQT